MKILFTQWFKTTPEILTYKIYCLYQNLSNKHIDKVVLFIDDCEFNNVFSEKLIVVPIQTRLSYKMWMDYADKEYQKDIKILANSDVYFNDSLSFLDGVYEWEETLYVVTRKDLTKEGATIPSGETYNPDEKKQLDPQFSQDAWIYKQIGIDFDKEYILGILHCENLFRHSAQRSGIQTFNLMNHIELMHVDWRTTKTYSRSDYIPIPIESRLILPYM